MPGKQRAPSHIHYLPPIEHKLAPVDETERRVKTALDAETALLNSRPRSSGSSSPGGLCSLVSQSGLNC